MVPVPCCMGKFITILTGWQLLVSLPHVVSSWGEECSQKSSLSDPCHFTKVKGVQGQRAGCQGRMNELGSSGSKVQGGPPSGCLIQGLCEVG